MKMKWNRQLVIVTILFLIFGNIDLVASESVLFEYDFEFDSSSSSAGQLSFPFGITTDSSDRIISVDANNHRIQVFDFTGAFLFEFSTAIDPFGITTDSSDRIIVVYAKLPQNFDFASFFGTFFVTSSVCK